MAHVIELKCPGCGERLNLDMKNCPSCHGPVIISTFESVHSMPSLDVNKYVNNYKNALKDNPDNDELNISLAMCYLKLKLYDKALFYFEKEINNNYSNPNAYFYAAICLLQGKKAFVQQRVVINKILEYINAAIMLDESNGIYHYFLAYIKYDYFSRKFFNITPSYKEESLVAKSYGVSDIDINTLFEMLSVERPSIL